MLRAAAFEVGVGEPTPLDLEGGMAALQSSLGRSVVMTGGVVMSACMATSALGAWSH